MWNRWLHMIDVPLAFALCCFISLSFPLLLIPPSSHPLLIYCITVLLVPMVGVELVSLHLEKELSLRSVCLKYVLYFVITIHEVMLWSCSIMTSRMLTCNACVRHLPHRHSHCVIDHVAITVINRRISRIQQAARSS